MESKEESIHGKCDSCGKDLVLCPACEGTDTGISEDEDSQAFYICLTAGADNGK